VEIGSCSSITVPADSRLAARLSDKVRSSAEGTSLLDQGDSKGDSGEFASIGGVKVPWGNQAHADSRRPFGKFAKAFDPASHRSSTCSGECSPRSLRARRGSKCSAGTCSTISSPRDTPCNDVAPESEDELLRAVRTGSLKGVEEALTSGSVPHSRTLREQTPLMLAACCDGEEGLAIMEKLVAAGCDIEAADESGYTPLMHACANTNFEAAEWLVQRGAAVNAKASNGRTPVMLATCSSKGSFGLVKFLIQQGARLDMQDDEGWSTLFFACDHMNYALIRWLLLRRHADLNEKAKDGQTPLTILQRRGIGIPQGRCHPKSNLDRVLLDMDALQGKVPRANSPSSPRKRAAARQRQRSPGSSPRQMSPAGSLSQMSSTGSPRSVVQTSSSQSDMFMSQSSDGRGSPANSPPSSGRTSRKDSARSPRSRRATRRVELGVPAAAWQAPEELDDCKAMVHMYVPAKAHSQDCKNVDVYISNLHRQNIENEGDLFRIIAEWGPSRV